MTNLHTALARSVPSVERMITGLRNSILGAPTTESGSCPALQVTVRCGRCGELISTRVDKANDLLCEYADGGRDDEEEDEGEMPAPTGFTLRKDVLGRKCQNLVQFQMTFNVNRQVTDAKVQGGEFVRWTDTA